MTKLRIPGVLLMLLLLPTLAPPALAIAITPAQPGASVSYIPRAPYTVGALDGVTTLDPLSVELLPRGGTADFLATLRAEFLPDQWNFTAAAADLTGTFNIAVYEAVGTAANVGANFIADYVNGGGNILTFPGNFHWIQRVVTNHPVGGGHGPLEGPQHATIDRSRTFAVPERFVPYYDVLSRAEREAGRTIAPLPRFEDRPRRVDAHREHDWHAELYLVEDLGTDLHGLTTVQIFNGLR
jgi:hypothetical protein